MRLTNFLVRCNCGDRVLGLEQDSDSNVIAVGQSSFILRANNRQVAKLPVVGEPIHAFINGSLLTIRERGKKFWLCASDKTLLQLPITRPEVFDSVFVKELNRIILLTPESLVEISLDGSARILGDNSEEPCFSEQMVASKDIIATFRFGLKIYKTGFPGNRVGDSLYAIAAIVQNNKVIAADDSGTIDIIQALDGSIEPLGNVGGLVLFLGCCKGIPIAICETTVGPSAQCCCLKRGVWHRITLNGFHPECYAFIESKDCLAIGTLEGAIILWDIQRHVFTTFDLQATPRIVQLLWSQNRGELFAGSRDGRVFSCQIED